MSDTPNNPDFNNGIAEAFAHLKRILKLDRLRL